MNKKDKKQIKSILKVAVIMVVGLFILKYIPMQIWGDDILFDASAHITIVSFVLYIIWFFIDQNKKWRLPFFIISLIILSIVSMQRIYINAYNDIGLLLGLILSFFAIWYSNKTSLRNRIDF